MTKRYTISVKDEIKDQIDDLILVVNNTPKEERILYLFDEFTSPTAFILWAIEFALDFMNPRKKNNNFGDKND